jgi:methyl-accepting chemotaxis protein
MSISKQLMTMLAIAILGIIAVFSIGINKMELVYEKTNTCNVNSLPSVLVMADLQKNMYRIRLAVMQHLYSDSQSTRKEIEERYSKYRADFEKDFKVY